MKTKSLGAISAALVLAACTEAGGPTVGTSGGAITIPDQVVAIAAPYQDLATARLRAEDGCFWYMHAGPVETTLIPLRTVQGNPICSSDYEDTDGTALTPQT